MPAFLNFYLDNLISNTWDETILALIRSKRGDYIFDTLCKVIRLTLKVLRLQNLVQEQYRKRKIIFHFIHSMLIWWKRIYCKISLKGFLNTSVINLWLNSMPLNSTVPCDSRSITCSLLGKYDLVWFALICKDVIVTSELKWVVNTQSQTSLTDGMMMTSHCCLDRLMKWLHNRKKPPKLGKIQVLMKIKNEAMWHIENLESILKCVPWNDSFHWDVMRQLQWLHPLGKIVFE